MKRLVQVVWAGRRRLAGWEELCRDYRRRIRVHVEIRDRPVLVKSSGDAHSRLQAEADALLAAVPDRSWVMALDRRGRELDSRRFAERLGQLLEDRPHGICFVVGSDIGLARSILAGADERISLSRMTLPHHLARLLLYEQLYRALSIRAGMQYHRDPLA